MKDVAKFSSAAFVIGALRVNVKTFEISEQSILKFIQAVHTVSIVLCIGCWVVDCNILNLLFI